ncbi:IclR family transcriptional regulator [Candidatus Aerophobetes bacterium]|nr:IclR family transcriptional regulator [Candidatus Aerophobetes bacterium]
MPILTDLAEKTGTSAYLIVLDNDEALCLERIDCHHNFQVLFLKIGGRMPLHIGAGSRVLLAYLPEMEIEKIVKSKGLCPRTKYSIANYQALEKNLQKIRKQGYALSWKDVHEGAAALGCPVRNWKNEVVAAISISGMADDFSKQRLPHLVQMVKDASCELSHRLSATV